MVDYKISKDVLAYASLSQGFKSGGFNAFGLVPAFKPETVDAYEAGVKTELFDRLLRFNADGFLYNYDNLQTRQGGYNRRRGDRQCRPLRGSRARGGRGDAGTGARGLKLGVNATYLDARFLDGTLQRGPLTATYKFGGEPPARDRQHRRQPAQPRTALAAGWNRRLSDAPQCAPQVDPRRIGALPDERLLFRNATGGDQYICVGGHGPRSAHASPWPRSPTGGASGCLATISTITVTSHRSRR